MTANPVVQGCDGVVVVVEDEQDTRELLQELLEGRGYRVVTAQDGVEALAVLRSAGLVCFVLLDMMMPTLDGFGVVAALAADPGLSKVRVCISTSAPERAPPGLMCLPKPLDIERLFEIVDGHCAAERCAI